MFDKNIDFKKIDELINSPTTDSSGTTNQKIELLIAQEELRKRQEKERQLRLEMVQNEKFRKKLEKAKAEIEYQEFAQKLREREVFLLKMESDSVDAKQKIMDEIRESALEAMGAAQETDFLENLDFQDRNEENRFFEKQKFDLINNIRSKKQKLREKEEEVTRLIEISNLDLK